MIVNRFDGAVKLKAISIVGGPDGSAPSVLKVDDIDFATASTGAPAQEWALQEDLRGVMEYPTQVSKFNGVHCLDLYFSGTFGADFSEISFGKFSEQKRQAVEAVYEARAVPSDHKVPQGEGAAWHGTT
eukprot:gene3459-13519_t